MQAVRLLLSVRWDIAHKTYNIQKNNKIYKIKTETNKNKKKKNENSVDKYNVVSYNENKLRNERNSKGVIPPDK